jgi:hypothetical protein
MESKFYNGKAEPKELVITLEENDPILISIKDALKENNVFTAELITMKGSIKNFKVNYFEKSSLKTISIFDSCEVVKCSGEFKYDLGPDKLFGRARINYRHKDKVFDGILNSGFACDGLEITLRFYEL